MEYTISQLAKMAKVSVRTLRYYDQIDLLKPAYHAINGYRCYGEKELLTLQQILFFRELGFELKKIKEIIHSSDFNQVAALGGHKRVLKKKIERLNQLIVTIDDTMKHIRGEMKMNEKKLYEGFDQKEYEKYIAKTYGDEGKRLIAKSKERTKHWKKQDWESYRKMIDDLYTDLLKVLEAKQSPDSQEVQELMRRHFESIKVFYTPTKEVYIGLGSLYQEHPDFGKFFGKYHPDLATYLAKAMLVYAERNF